MTNGSCTDEQTVPQLDVQTMDFDDAATTTAATTIAAAGVWPRLCSRPCGL
eukprot:m.230759 g.230759  ORF g.230759 m.230759 type:complete len:51 (+) comp22416_c16_seq1:250-402(+)